jgi:hypothetical protein
MADEARKFKGKAYEDLTTDDVAGQQFVVTGPYITVKTGTLEGVRVLGFYRDAPVPKDVNPEHLLHLLRHDLIGPTPVPAPTPLEQVGADGAGGGLPEPVAPPQGRGRNGGQQQAAPAAPAASSPPSGTSSSTGKK